MTEKTLDVIIPVYNGIPFIQRTLLGVINQTLCPTQIIVVNDGSTDNTVAELEKIKAAHPKVNIQIISKPNGGHSSATNVGIRASTSDYIALVDADDLWHPTKLEKQMSVFQNSKDEKLGVVYADYVNIDPDDNPLPLYPTVKLDPTVKGRVFEVLLQRGNLILGSNSAVLMKRQVFLDHGFFDENLRCGEDWEMWLRIAQTYHYDFYPEVLTFIRRHPGALSNQKMLHCQSDLYIMHKWKDEFLKFGGIRFIADYLSRITFTNQKNLLLNSEYDFLLNYIKEIADFPMPRLIIIWAFFRKIRKKIFKVIKTGRLKT